MKKLKIRSLAESALLVATAFALSWVQFPMPFGGSVTAVSMLPLLLIGYRRGALWGILSAVVYAILQMLQSFYPPPTASIVNYFLVVFLDYILAFGVLGLSFLFRKQKNGLLIAVCFCITLRFLCHFLSGGIIWGVYAWEGWSIWPYSFAYNGLYMAPELVLTFLASIALSKCAPKIVTPQS